MSTADAQVWEGGMADRAEQVALLAAQIATDNPTLAHALRGSVARVCHFADRLEAELRTYSPLEAILNTERRPLCRGPYRPAGG
jgi:hypothetical protein